MKRSKTSVTILAALTIGLSGSLKVLALCSMYRTSHISAEILLGGKKKGLEKKVYIIFLLSSVGFLSKKRNQVIQVQGKQAATDQGKWFLFTYCRLADCSNAPGCESFVVLFKSAMNGMKEETNLHKETADCSHLEKALETQQSSEGKKSRTFFIPRLTGKTDF